MLLVFLLELGAAMAGTIFIAKSGNSPLAIKIFVYYLWFMVFVETLGLYPIYAYFSNYTSLSFIKDTPFERNYWLYNIHKVVSFMAYLSLFIVQIGSKKTRGILWILLIMFAVSSVVNLMLSGVFFIRHAAFTTFFGTLLLVVVIFIYYYELLRSDRILKFHYDPVFFISVGALVWNLVVTPLFIYNKYFSLQSPDFIMLHSGILKLANVFLYGSIIAGFWLSFKNQKIKLRKV